MAGTDYVPPLPGTLHETSAFGQRDGELHAGVDYAAPAGTTIRAVLPGRVTQAGNSGGWGNTVVIDHGTVNGEHLFTRYAHMLTAPAVKVGQTVTAGQTIGQVGSTGDSTGNHLHFGTYVGSAPTNATARDPATVLGKPGTVIVPGPGGIPLPVPGGEDVTGALAAILERIAKAADAIASETAVAEKIATSVTKLFLPNNLLRAAAGALGAVLLVFSLWLLGREMRA